MNVLVACEESQRVCTAFREKGHNAFSCDILPCSGGHPEWHIQTDVLSILNPTTHYEQGYNEYWEGICFYTENAFHRIKGKWDLIVAFPPCTYLTVTGNRWFNIQKYGEKAIERLKNREDAKKFFLQIANADCEKIVIENPVGVMSTIWRKPDQIIHPYYFAENENDTENIAEKKTCLWLKGVSPLKYEICVNPPERQKLPGGKTMPSWYSKKYSRENPSGESRQAMRSKTFPGVAKAMADQWG